MERIPSRAKANTWEDFACPTQRREIDSEFSILREAVVLISEKETTESQFFSAMILYYILRICTYSYTLESLGLENLGVART